MGRVLGPAVLTQLAAARPDRLLLDPEGRSVEPGDQVKARGEGNKVFEVKHLHANGDVTAYGPVNRDPNGHRAYRSFKLSQIRLVTKPVRRRDG